MVGQVLVGNMWSLLVCSALPEELLSDNAFLCIATLVAPFACAVAVWLIGNIGAEKEGGFKWALIGRLILIGGCMLVVNRQQSKERRFPKPTLL
ncbi:hypothetical protein FHG87_021598 [Trinorchestia longiramus]|nr:hypothetical protein FHG87_021598 [Trinorchestia longiramus]